MVFAGGGTGTVTGTDINCPGDCFEVYTNGDAVALTATPTSGSTFSGWSGCPTPVDNTCIYTAHFHRTITANFTPAPTTGGGNPPGPAGPTGQRAAALKKCAKVKSKAKKKKCKKRASSLPV